MVSARLLPSVSESWRSLRLGRPVRGQGLVEYLLIVALISIAAIVAVGALGATVNGQWEYIRPFVGS